jgi:small acid-soluble spore protein F (minor alpha/beta-type SASP)
VENLDEKIKNEIIIELGLFDKVKKYGWKSLTAKETGRIGGLITKRKKLMQMEKQSRVAGQNL